MTVEESEKVICHACRDCVPYRGASVRMKMILHAKWPKNMWEFVVRTKQALNSVMKKYLLPSYSLIFAFVDYVAKHKILWTLPRGSGSRRPQPFKIRNNISGTIMLSMGALRGYMLSLLLFMVLTHNNIIKLVDGIGGFDQQEQWGGIRDGVQWLTDWERSNSLSLTSVVMNWSETSSPSPGGGRGGIMLKFCSQNWHSTAFNIIIPSKLFTKLKDP